MQIIIQLGSHYLCQISYKNCQFTLCYFGSIGGGDGAAYSQPLVSTKQHNWRITFHIANFPTKGNLEDETEKAYGKERG